MANPTIPMKRGDTWPPLVLGLRDINEDPVTLEADDEVRLLLKSDTLLIVTGTVDITDADLAIITYYWEAGDTDIAGTYNGEVEVTRASDGKVFTVPNDETESERYFTLIIAPDLGGAAPV